MENKLLSLINFVLIILTASAIACLFVSLWQKKWDCDSWLLFATIVFGLIGIYIVTMIRGDRTMSKEYADKFAEIKKEIERENNNNQK